MNASHQIKAACTKFLASWNRHGWMIAHGEWASERWEEERRLYEEAVDDLQTAVAHLLDAVQELPAAEYVGTAPRNQVILPDPAALAALAALVTSVKDAAARLDGQVAPGDGDYIAEGTIDPDGVADDAVALGVGDSWEGWDCREGWDAYRHGTALYMRWWREAHGARRDRDLWVLVAADFFEEAA